MPDREVQAIGRDKGSTIDEDIPPLLLRASNPVERVLHAGDIGLGRVGKQIGLAGVSLRQQAVQLGLMNAQIRWRKRHISDGGASSPGKFANAIHRVMIIKGEQISSVWGKGVRLPDKLERAAGIGSEDHGIFIGRGMEVAEYETADAIHQAGHGLGSWIG